MKAKRRLQKRGKNAQSLKKIVLYAASNENCQCCTINMSGFK